MRRVLKWVGYTLGGLIGLIVLAAIAIYFLSESRVNKHYDVAVRPIAIPSDSALIATGRKLATTRGCIACHGGNMAGGKFIDDPVFGQIWAANLTSGKGGAASRYRDEDWVRAIRHGLRQDGKPLLVMPSEEFQFTDEDIAALAAYIESLPAVDAERPPASLGPVGRVLVVAGKAIPAEHIDHDAAPPVVTPGATVEYGKYVAMTCTGCHGAGFSGGKIMGDPSPDVPTNITMDKETGIGTWTQEDFARLLRTGTRPDGSTVKPGMPYRLFAELTDMEIQAMWMYLQTVPPKPEGNR